uniref:RNA-directed DNA polymerase n=1 Tax=Trichuris muris TaxID=70415 RepID=A0A5S6Q175_TRIMR
MPKREATPPDLPPKGCASRYGIERFRFDKPSTWPDWLEFFNRYLVSARLTMADDDFKINELILCMGPPSHAIFQRSTLAPEEKRSYEKVTKMFSEHFRGARNIVYELARLHRTVQRDGEPVDSFINAVFAQAENCDLDNVKVSAKELLMQSQLIAGMANRRLAAELQMDPSITLQQVVQRLRLDANIASQQAVIHPTSRSACGAQETDDVEIHAVTRDGRSGRFQRQRFKQVTQCPNCGYAAHETMQLCPARGKSCNRCQKTGHFAKVCRSKRTREMNAVAVRRYDSPMCRTGPDSEAAEEQTCFLDKIVAGGTSGVQSESTWQPWRAELLVNGKAACFKLDSGADVTCVPEAHQLVPMQLSPVAGLKLLGPSNAPLSVLGSFKATMEHKGRHVEEVCYVIRDLNEPLLSRDASVRLRLIQRVCFVSEPHSQGLSVAGFPEVAAGDSIGACAIKSACSRDPEFARVVSRHPKLFEGLGMLQGEYKIQLKPGAEPYAISAPRRVAIHYREPLRQHLDEMVRHNVIRPVSEPTEWCSGIVVVPKADGKSVRVCVDLTALNKSVRRSLFTLPTVEEQLALLTGAKVFSKLDANSGFWQIPLSRDSSLLTTFMTPFGRFCFQRLPFGISSAPEYFQCRMNDILAGLPGVICHMDDVLVFGNSYEQHDRRLAKVLERLSDSGLTLNAKCQFRRRSLVFLGHLITDSGILPDPSKVEAVVKLPPPGDVGAVRRFIGMVNHFGRFIDKLAEKTKPLRDLLKEDVEFVWRIPQQRAFDELKADLQKCVELAPFNPAYKTIVSADASSVGLGAVLLQESPGGAQRPVAFASRCLTATEQRYAQIEKEAYAVTWACERFRMFLLGKQFHVETDHKPLVALLGQKSLDDLPPRIQRFRVRLMPFNFTIGHVPGKFMTAADTLSRAAVAQPTKSDDDFAAAVTAFIESVMVGHHEPEARLRQIALSQTRDPVCTQLMALCASEWPPEQSKVPRICQSYWRYRAHLTLSPDGILLFDDRLVIPQEMRREILKRIHSGHQGIVKCAARARESVWWPGLSSELHDFVTNCRVCTSHRQVRHEPMLASTLPLYPWQVVATDIFNVKGKEYLVVVDYYSRYIELALLKDKTSETCINILKSIFARFGIPEIVRCDNGPCYSAYEFRQFAKQYEFQILTSSPLYPQSNGEAERAVAIMENILKKCDDIYLGLLAYRTAPMATGFSPAELMFGRSLRTNVPTDRKNLLPRQMDHATFREREELAKRRQSATFDRRHGVRPRLAFVPGDRVFIRDRREHGTIVTKEFEAPRSYQVETSDGARLRRNAFHLLPDHGGNEEQTSRQPASHLTPEPGQGTGRPPRIRRPPARYADCLFSERGM